LNCSIPNLFLGRTKDFHEHNIIWDEQFKLFEHYDFFLNFPEYLTITHVPIKFFKEIKINSTEYNIDRYNRMHVFHKLFCEKYNIDMPVRVSNVTYDWIQNGLPSLLYIKKKYKHLYL
jgi:hypothetical protein